MWPDPLRSSLVLELTEHTHIRMHTYSHTVSTGTYTVHTSVRTHLSQISVNLLGTDLPVHCLSDCVCFITDSQWWSWNCSHIPIDWYRRNNKKSFYSKRLQLSLAIRPVWLSVVFWRWSWPVGQKDSEKKDSDSVQCTEEEELLDDAVDCSLWSVEVKQLSHVWMFEQLVFSYLVKM